MGPHAVDLPDPWDTPGDTIPGNESDDLISRLAGDDVERLMGGRPARVGAGPVQELTSQLDNFFEELRQRQTETIQALARQEQGGLIINDAERQALVGDLDMDEASDIETTLAAHAGFVDPDPHPAWYARPIEWCGAMMESLSTPARITVNIVAVLSFLAACAALIYVIILRQA